MRHNINIHSVFPPNSSQLKDRIRTPMILSIAYSASIGGAGTLIGSGSPLAFKGILEE
jgi:Na+/H+ antiporter NhaD/arsenite permease-like protein